MLILGRRPARLFQRASRKRHRTRRSASLPRGLRNTGIL